MAIRSNRAARYLAVGSVLLMVAGCGPSGPKLGTVEGTVTLGEEPLEDAKVVFLPESGSPSVGMTDANGHYRLAYTPDRDGALVGEHVVQITTWKMISRDDGGEDTLPERVPAEYNSQSTLVREVKPGKNRINFDL